MEVIGDDILIDGQVVGKVTVPPGSLREALINSWDDSTERGYFAGVEDGIEQEQERREPYEYA